jgi:hypothetical protein
MLVPDRPQMKIYYGACELRAGYQRLQTHTQNVSYLLLYHARVVARTRLIVTV